MTVNRELFHKIADHLERHPESHDMDLWADDRIGPQDSICGAAMCNAGWAIEFSPDYEFEWTTRPKTSRNGVSTTTGAHSRTITAGARWNAADRSQFIAVGAINRDGEPMSFSAAGADALGLTRYEASALFSAVAAPKHGLTWPEALRAIGDGAPVVNTIADGAP